MLRVHQASLIGGNATTCSEPRASTTGIFLRQKPKMGPFFPFPNQKTITADNVWRDFAHFLVSVRLIVPWKVAQCGNAASSLNIPSW